MAKVHNWQEQHSYATPKRSQPDWSKCSKKSESMSLACNHLVVGQFLFWFSSLLVVCGIFSASSCIASRKQTLPPQWPWCLRSYILVVCPKIYQWVTRIHAEIPHGTLKGLGSFGCARRSCRNAWFSQIFLLGRFEIPTLLLDHKKGIQLEEKAGTTFFEIKKLVWHWRVMILDLRLSDICSSYSLLYFLLASTRMLRIPTAGLGNRYLGPGKRIRLLWGSLGLICFHPCGLQYSWQSQVAQNGWGVKPFQIFPGLTQLITVNRQLFSPPIFQDANKTGHPTASLFQPDPSPTSTDSMHPPFFWRTASATIRSSTGNLPAGHRSLNKWQEHKRRS